MDALHRDGFLFLAPGILHRLGNNLFAIQGHAQLLGVEGPEGRERQSILMAADRGNRTLALMRLLLGEGAERPADATQLLLTLTELFGVPLRERGLTVEAMLPDDSRCRAVDARSFCLLVVEAVRLLVAAQPSGRRGGLRLRLGDEVGGGWTVEVRFAAEEGSLPFPVSLAEVRSGLDRLLPDARQRPVVREAADGVALVYAAGEVALEEEA